MERQEFGRESTFRFQTQDVVLESFADETIAVHLGTGRYFSIDLIGADIIELLESGCGLGAITEHLASRYDADPAVVEGAVTEFVSCLLDEGLIHTAPDRQPGAALPDPSRSSVAFSPPAISVYSDMEDLLLLDPIHDVDETGWPVRADSTQREPSTPRDSE